MFCEFKIDRRNEDIGVLMFTISTPTPPHPHPSSSMIFQAASSPISKPKPNIQGPIQSQSKSKNGLKLEIRWAKVQVRQRRHRLDGDSENWTTQTLGQREFDKYDFLRQREFWTQNFGVYFRFCPRTTKMALSST